MTLEEFKIVLDNHDWYYEMSGDMKAYDKGNNEEKRLRTIATNLGQEYIELFRKYQNRIS